MVEIRLNLNGRVYFNKINFESNKYEILSDNCY